MRVQSWRSRDGEHVIVISDLTLRAWQRATLALHDVRAELEDEEPTIVRPRRVQEPSQCQFCGPGFLGTCRHRPTL